MEVEFDPAKRDWTLKERGLDFRKCADLIGGQQFTQEDDRQAYPEPRFLTYAMLDARLVMFAWTPIAKGIRVFSMRKCNEREQQKFADRVG